VVAEEVRKLAEESGQAAGSIASLIGEIQSQTARAVGVVEGGVRHTEAGASTVERAREAFLQVGQSVEELESRVTAIAAAIEEIAVSSHKMQENFSGVAAIAEESSSSSQEVSASTQESTAVTEQISAHAQELARTATELEQMVRVFTLADQD
jgi:methyl-accepting chemotaxis protein